MFVSGAAMTSPCPAKLTKTWVRACSGNFVKGGEGLDRKQFWKNQNGGSGRISGEENSHFEVLFTWIRVPFIKILYFIFLSQHMLMSFRVTELQVLLGFAGRSKSGRKHELMGRSLQLLKCEGNYPVRAKIRELYQRRCPRKAAALVPAVVQLPRPPPRTTSNESAGVPVHPDVRLTTLPFFNHIDDLVKPTSLGKSSRCPVGLACCVFF